MAKKFNELAARRSAESRERVGAIYKQLRAEMLLQAQWRAQQTAK